MFDTSHYLHYVLDSRDDCHFTDDFLKLSPQSYLWHMLKERHQFDNVVFVDLDSAGPELTVYDSGSEQLLRPVKKGWFSYGKKDREEGPQRIERKSFRPNQFKQQAGTLLQWLLECQKEAKSQRTALVFTADALRSLYADSEKKGRELLGKFVRNGVDSGVLVLRVSKDVPSLRRAFLSRDRWLSELDPMVYAALHSHGTRPLFTALQEQLRAQLVDFGSYEPELLNMLWQEAMEKSFGLDSPEELKDQAVFLRLCCASGQGVMDGHNPYTPLKRSAIYSKLSRKEFRTALREQTCRLREQSSTMPLEDLFTREYGKIVTEPLQLCCDDELTRNVTALTLPEDYLKKNRNQARNLQQLKKAVVTLWNKDRNEAVTQMILTACDAVRQASESGDHDTISDSMTLLNLCARQLCADLALNDNLDRIFEVGTELLNTSAQYFSQKNVLQEESEDEFDLYRVSKAKLTVQLGNEAILDAKRMRLESLRSGLSQAILYFNENPRSERVETLLQESLETWKTQLDQAHADEMRYGDDHNHESEDNSDYDL